MRAQLLTSVVAFSALTGIAFAQTNPPAATTAPGATTRPATPNAASGTANPSAGMQSVTAVAVRFLAVQPADVLASRLIGTNVYNNQNESIGEIEDVVIDDGKTVRAIVIGVGGFLGLGERYVAVEPGNVVLTRQGADALRAVINTSRDDLKNATPFTYNRRRR